MSESDLLLATWPTLLEPCLNLAMMLAPAELVVAHMSNAAGELVGSKAAACGRYLTKNGATDLGCKETLARGLSCKEFYKVEPNLKAQPHSILLPLRWGSESFGVLQLLTFEDPQVVGSKTKELAFCIETLVLLIRQNREAAVWRGRAESAQQASMAKSKFLSSVSHEIRTPLGVILGFAELALGAGSRQEEVRDYLTSIRRNAQQATEILGEVLDLAKIEASRLEVEEMHFALLPMLAEVVGSLSIQAKEKGLKISIVKSEPLPQVVRTDPTRLRQILTNLIGNAVKFTDQGEVTLSVRLLSPPVVGETMRLEFSVRDTGIGIPDELKTKLFQPFSQLEVSTTRRFGGTGLGLMLSKQLVSALGGDLALQSSQPGGGSTFAFTITAGPFGGPSAQQENHHAKTSFKSECLRGKKVLVIDDSEDNQVLISRYLNAEGMQVEVAGDGLKGLEKAAQDDFDLVVLDIQMPMLDGHQVARRLRANGFVRPIVALTAHAFKEDRERAFQSGFNEYLTKPINRLLLLKTLGERLRGPDSVTTH